MKGTWTSPGINADRCKPPSCLLPANFVMKTLEGHQKTESTNKTEPSVRMYVRIRSFNIKWLLYVPRGLTLKIPRSAHTVCLFCTDYMNKQQLFPYTALTDWFL